MPSYKPRLLTKQQIKELRGKDDPSTDDLEALVHAEIMKCPGCKKMVHTYPAEGVPAQSLRACNCGEVFAMDFNHDPVYRPTALASA